MSTAGKWNWVRTIALGVATGILTAHYGQVGMAFALIAVALAPWGDE